MRQCIFESCVFWERLQVCSLFLSARVLSVLFKVISCQLKKWLGLTSSQLV